SRKGHFRPTVILVLPVREQRPRTEQVVPEYVVFGTEHETGIHFRPRFAGRLPEPGELLEIEIASSGGFPTARLRVVFVPHAHEVVRRFGTSHKAMFLAPVHEAEIQNGGRKLEAFQPYVFGADVERHAETG